MNRENKKKHPASAASMMLRQETRWTHIPFMCSLFLDTVY